MHGTQHLLRDGSSQPSFESGRNYREFKPGGWTTGLEEDEITWYSNAQKYTGNNEFGLEEGKITWYSNIKCALMQQKSGLEEDEITWHSNQHSPQLVNRVGLAEDKITWYSNWTVQDRTV